MIQWIYDQCSDCAVPLKARVFAHNGKNFDNYFVLRNTKKFQFRSMLKTASGIVSLHLKNKKNKMGVNVSVIF